MELERTSAQVLGCAETRATQRMLVGGVHMQSL